MEKTARHALPFIVPGQAQKEMTHNEALALIDLLLHPHAQTIGGNAPPAAPVDGECHVVGDAPTGAWAGNGGTIAGWTPAGWRFAVPRDGMIVALPGGAQAHFDGAAWNRIDPAVIPSPDADGALPEAIRRILTALQQHGIVAAV